MVGKVAGAGIYSGVTVETTLDPKLQPFLHDHQIDGTPVLPGVMGIEAFAEAAALMLPGWHAEAVEDVHFLAPFKFYRHEPRTVTTNVMFHADGEFVTADCRLIGQRALPNQKEPQVTTHFTARVRMTRSAPEASITTVPNQSRGEVIAAADIYKVYFHGPAYQVINRAWREGNRMIGAMAKDLPSNHKPADSPVVIAPRWIELCFQTAGLWEIQEEGKFGLPLHIDRVTVVSKLPSTDAELHAVVTPRGDGSFDAEVVDAKGVRYVQLKGYRTIALPTKIADNALRGMAAVA
jgi:3-hydroxymyristoyl/3-hydroxydecanoyl-(acyl carrier protein) dehydratase